MADPQSFGDFLTRALEWIGERFQAAVTWFSAARTSTREQPMQDRASIREELTQRMANMERNGNVDGAMGRAAVGNGFRIVGDLLTGGISPETRAQVQQDFRERVAKLPTEDQATLRDVRRLTAAGGFSETEMADIEREASQRSRRTSQQAR